MNSESEPNFMLVGIKLLHTLVWFFFVACIVAIPVAAGLHRFQLAAVLAGVVLLECLVLGLNRCRCPLTDWAGRYTGNRVDNFDIYLPVWLARWNKVIFGVIFVLGGLFALLQWRNL